MKRADTGKSSNTIRTLTLANRELQGWRERTKRYAEYINLHETWTFGYLGLTSSRHGPMVYGSITYLYQGQSARSEPLPLPNSDSRFAIAVPQ